MLEPRSQSGLHARAMPTIAPAALLVASMLGALSPKPATAQTGGPYDLSWSTLDSGGGAGSVGGAYWLGGGIGQPDAGRHTGGTYALTGGFWFGGVGVTAIGPPDENPGPEGAAPRSYRLFAGRPSPFASQTVIGYDLPHASSVELRVYDASGRLVRALASGEHPAGHHEVLWRGDDASGSRVASGAYFFHLEAGDWSATEKIIVAR